MTILRFFETYVLFVDGSYGMQTYEPLTLEVHVSLC